MSDTQAADTHPKKPLPPGVVLGPDGKPCKICTAFRHWKPRTDKPKQPSASSASSSSSSSAQGPPGQQKTAAMMAAFASGAGFVSATTTADEASAEDPPRPANCPPDVEQLGRATWTFLHTTAAYYPERPTPSQRVQMLSLLRALPVLYPCSHCATHLGECMQRRPPDVSGREGLSRWLCERHNEVNERLGKERFECAVEKLDERWKDGPADRSCD